jgi:hypothetical protein
MRVAFATPPRRPRLVVRHPAGRTHPTNPAELRHCRRCPGQPLPHHLRRAGSDQAAQRGHRPALVRAGLTPSCCRTTARPWSAAPGPTTRQVAAGAACSRTTWQNRSRSSRSCRTRSSGQDHQDPRRRRASQRVYRPRHHPRRAGADSAWAGGRGVHLAPPGSARSCTTSSNGLQGARLPTCASARTTALPFLESLELRAWPECCCLRVVSHENRLKAGPWIVLNAGPCTDYYKSGLHRGLHKKFWHRGLIKSIHQGKPWRLSRPTVGRF